MAFISDPVQVSIKSNTFSTVTAPLNRKWLILVSPVPIGTFVLEPAPPAPPTPQESWSST